MSKNDSNTMPSITYLKPLQEERGRNEDAQRRYLARVSGTQGETPDEVLLDWFQEQPEAAENWSWLDLATFSWTKIEIKLDELPAGEVFRGGEEQLKRLQNDVHWERQWIWKQVQEHGTWHLPPIVFETSALQDVPAWVNSPLHLAEGYHRLAAVHRAKSENLPIAAVHTFWMARSAPIITKDSEAT